MILARLPIAFIVFFLFGAARAEQPALNLSGPYEDAARHLVRSYDLKIGIRSVAFLPDGRSALVAGSEGILILDLSTGREIRSFAGENRKDPSVTSAAISKDGRYVLVGKIYALELWEIATGRKLGALKGETGIRGSVALSPDGRLGLQGSDEGQLILWDLQAGQAVRELRPRTGNTAVISGVAFARGGRFGLSGGALSAPLQLWDLQTGQQALEFEGNKIGSVAVGPFISSLAVSPDGRTAITGGSDKIVYVWDLKSGKKLRKFTKHTSFVNAVAISPSGRFAISGGSNTLDKDSKVTIKLWSLSNVKELHEFAGGLKRVDTLAFSSDGRFILSGGMGDKLRLWDASEWTKASK